MAENKRARFIRIAEQRTQNVLDALRALSKCSNPATYELTEADIEKIFAAIDAATKDARDTMLGRKRFTLSSEEENKGEPFSNKSQNAEEATE